MSSLNKVAEPLKFPAENVLVSYLESKLQAHTIEKKVIETAAKFFAGQETHTYTMNMPILAELVTLGIDTPPYSSETIKTLVGALRDYASGVPEATDTIQQDFLSEFNNQTKSEEKLKDNDEDFCKNLEKMLCTLELSDNKPTSAKQENSEKKE